MTMPPGGPPPRGPQFSQQPYGAPPQGYPPPGPYAPGPGYGPPPGYPPPGGMPPRFGQAPGAGYGLAPGGQCPPIVIDVGKADGRKAIIGSIVAGALGLVVLISGLVGAVDGGEVAYFIAIGFGVLFLLLPASAIIRRDKVFRPRSLVFESAGLRWDDPKGAPWAVPWSELAAVAISKHSPKQVGPEGISDKISGAASDKLLGERVHVRLDFYPADPGFAGRHPELAHLWERQGVRNGYRFPLGMNVKFIPIIAQAMGRFAPNIFGGVHATEGMMGLS